MTLPAGGETIQVGPAPILLTDTAPVTVINPSTTARIWLSGSANAITATGVPVDAGTAYQWQTPGTLWAQADPAAPDPVTVIITGSSDNWTPSPVTMAAAVAEQLAAQGVPVKLLTTFIGQYTVVPGSNTGMIDVSEYATLYASIVWQNTIEGPPYIALAQFAMNNAGQLYWQPQQQIASDNTGAAAVTLAVAGNQVHIANTTTTETMTVSLWGISRPAPLNPPAGWGAVWSATATPAQPYPTLTLTGGQPTTGPATCWLWVSPLPSGLNHVQLQAQAPGGNLPNLVLYDYTMPAAGTSIQIPFTCAFPQSIYSPVVKVYSTLTANAAVLLHTVPNYHS